MSNVNQDIDAVILWVDGSDPKWLQEKSKYATSKESNKQTNVPARFRDWDNLKYWFRGIEQNAPWIRKIHFVTWGHLPDFLDITNPKINVVNHKDIIDEKFLPTFNSSAIEVNINKIEGLAEKFIFFNDDFFIINKVKKEDFYWKNLPKLEGLEGAVVSVGDENPYYHMLLNNVDVINRHFNKKESIRKNFFKWYNFRYGLENVRNLCLAPWKEFVGFKNAHLPVPMLKSTWDKVWAEEEELLLKTSSHKFRSYHDLTQYVFRYWQLASGEFYPQHAIGKMIGISEESIDEITSCISSEKIKLLCMNDDEELDNIEGLKKKINIAFEKKFPNKSHFEK